LTGEAEQKKRRRSTNYPLEFKRRLAQQACDESVSVSSRRIVDIIGVIGVIDGIAFQTNILALNASVEAARAGEQGRGGAVVASEVRNLSQRSTAAAREIKALIDDAVDKVDVGTKLVSQAGTTMHEIVDSVGRVSSIIGENTLAVREQNVGIEQINRAIGQMDEVTQQDAALVEQVAAASDSMRQQAMELGQAVSIFTLAEAGVAQVKGSSRGPNTIATYQSWRGRYYGSSSGTAVTPDGLRLLVEIAQHAQIQLGHPFQLGWRDIRERRAHHVRHVGKRPLDQVAARVAQRDHDRPPVARFRGAVDQATQHEIVADTGEVGGLFLGRFAQSRRGRRLAVTAVQNRQNDIAGVRQVVGPEYRVGRVTQHLLQLMGHAHEAHRHYGKSRHPRFYALQAQFGRPKIAH
jgi:hypothetical protein